MPWFPGESFVTLTETATPFAPCTRSAAPTTSFSAFFSWANPRGWSAGPGDGKVAGLGEARAEGLGGASAPGLAGGVAACGALVGVGRPPPAQATLSRSAMKARKRRNTSVSAGSAALEVGPALADEGLHAFPEVLAATGDLLILGLDLEHRVQVAHRRAVEAALDQAVGQSRAAGEPRGEGFHLGLESLRRHDLVDQPEPQRLVRAHFVRGK